MRGLRRTRVSRSRRATHQPVRDAPGCGHASLEEVNLYRGDTLHRFRDELGWIGVVFELALEVAVVSGHVEVTVAAQVEQDRLLFAGLLAAERLVDGGTNGMGALRGRDDPLRPGELHRRLE